jgi:Cysteine-rich secretory protein family
MVYTTSMARKASFLSAALAVVVLGLAAGPTSGEPSSDQARRLLTAHNEARHSVGSPMLAWSDYLTREAQFWADHLARTETFEHAPERPTQEPQGENLWAGTRGAFTPEAMVGAWVTERKNFRPGRFPDVSTTGDWSDVGHYTQLIWAKTTHVGCAVARNAKSDILVCRYSPAGNIIGDYSLPQSVRKRSRPVSKKPRHGG